MLQTFRNAWKIEDLRRKILFTLFMVLLYRLGSAVLVGSLLLLIPAAWLQLTHWFDRFAVKSDHVFAAVTGYLYTLTGTAITAGAAGIVLALCLFLFCGMSRRTAD